MRDVQIGWARTCMTFAVEHLKFVDHHQSKWEAQEGLMWGNDIMRDTFEADE